MHDDQVPLNATTAAISPSEPSAPVIPETLKSIVTATVPALALAACGEGSGTTAPPTAAPPPPPPLALTAVQASRFLGQATMGPSKAEITALQASSYSAWLDTQFALPRAQTFWDWMTKAGYANQKFKNGTDGFDNAVWKQLISANDQLRQRVGVALLDWLVISVDGLMATSFQQFAAAAYLDVLWDNVLGNYRTLLDKISTNTAMSIYLTFIGNRKADPNIGSEPDENYARELMQLFTLGLYKLNADGTQQLVGGKPVETYGPNDVSGLARVFTGFNYDPIFNYETPAGHDKPLIQRAGEHETGTKSFLGTTIPSGTDGFASLKIALDTIFAHQNVPPFVSKQLIQRLVTSNPSPAYVGRVSAVFANNGSGVRGDMKAVIRAILTDSEARSDASLNSTTTGKLREPVIRLTNWARAFSVTSKTDAWNIGNTSSPIDRLAQGIGHAPSVFNFFRPGYTPPNTAISAASLVAPEFQITNELSVIAYINVMQDVIENGAADAKPDYGDIVAKATDSQALIDQVNLILAANQLSATTVATIKTAIDSINTNSNGNKARRVYTAILLAMASPDYIAQK